MLSAQYTDTIFLHTTHSLRPFFDILVLFISSRSNLYLFQYIFYTTGINEYAHNRTYQLDHTALKDTMRCVSVSADCLCLWDLTSQMLLKSIKGYSTMIRAIDTYSVNDCRRCIIASSDDILRIWDLERYICIGILKGHTSIQSVNVMHGISVVGIDLSKTVFSSLTAKEYLGKNGITVPFSLPVHGNTA